MKEAPNFLTCPAVPELPSPKGEDLIKPKKESQHPSAPTNVGRDMLNTKPATKDLVSTGRPGRKKGFLKILILLVVIGLGVLLIPPAIAVGRAAWAGLEARQALASLQTRLQLGDFDSAANETARAKQALEDVNQNLEGVGFFRDMPFIGTQVRTMQDVAVVGAHSLDSLLDLLDVAKAMSEALASGSQAVGQTSVPIEPSKRWQDLSKADKRNLLRTLQSSLPDIRLARDKIDLALALWSAIPQDRLLPPLAKVLQPMADFLPIMRQAMDQSVPLLEAMIPLAGYPDQKQYLLILQNSDEIRPAGGFIGSVAKVTLDGGDISDYQFFDVYNIDNPVSAVWKETPPEPLVKNLGVKAWFMRDANWSPDFVQSAERVLDFYLRESALQGKTEKTDSVIALEPGFFRELLRLIGPIEINGKSYDDRSFMDLLEYEVEIGFQQQGVKLEDRKAVLGELGAVILNKVQAMPKSDWPKLLNLVTTAFAEKQIMVYSRDAALQSLVDRRGWSGRAKPTVCDFTWVVDANLAALKTDGKMVKSVSYVLDARDVQKPVANLTLTYTNTVTKIDWRYTRYRSYTRVYVPEGSQWLSTKGAMAGDLIQTGGKFVPGKTDIMKELGKTVFGAFWAIEPGKTGELSFSYALPPSVSDCLAQNNYQLDWPKQPGADNTEINVKVIMPRTIVSADPSEPESKWGDAAYEAQADLREDRNFKVKY